MSFRLKAREKLEFGIRRIAQEQIDKALAEIDGDLPRHKVVHQVRKRCKKLRGLLRLVRPALGKTYTAENKIFRDAARSRSSLRDAKSMFATYDDLMDHFDSQVECRSFHSIRRSLNEQLQDVNPEMSSWQFFSSERSQRQ